MREKLHAATAGDSSKGKVHKQRWVTRLQYHLTRARSEPRVSKFAKESMNPRWKKRRRKIPFANHSRKLSSLKYRIAITIRNTLLHETQLTFIKLLKKLARAAPLGPATSSELPPVSAQWRFTRLTVTGVLGRCGVFTEQVALNYPCLQTLRDHRASMATDTLLSRLTPRAFDCGLNSLPW